MLSLSGGTAAKEQEREHHQPPSPPQQQRTHLFSRVYGKECSRQVVGVDIAGCKTRLLL